MPLFEDVIHIKQRTELSDLIGSWEKETDRKFKQKLKKIIIKIVEIKVTANFSYPF